MAAFSSIALGVGAAASVAGAAGSIASGISGANAQENAALAQLNAARAELDQQRKDRERALKLAEPSAQELASIDRLVQRNEAQLQQSMIEIDRNRQLLESIDPAIKEAGTQALQLLKGEDAKILEPIRQQRERQRKALEGQLSQRLGPGFRTSSAGIEALNSFDIATSDTLANAQQQSLGQLLNVAVQSRPNVSGQIQSTFGALLQGDAQALQAQQNIANRKVNAFVQSSPNQGTVQSAIGSAGAPFVGDAGRAAALGKGFDTLGGLGGILLGRGLGAPPAIRKLEDLLNG